MNKIICVFIFVTTIALSLSAQSDNCDYGVEAQQHIERGSKIVDEITYYSTYVKEPLLNAAHEYEQALKYNPKCEIIYLELAKVYTKLGEISTEEMYGSTSELQTVKDYYSKAASNFEKAIKYSNDPDVKIEANQALQKNYYVEKNFEENAKGKIKSLKHEKDLYKNTDGFFSLGVGYGAVFGQPGQMGVRASLFTQSKAGIGIVGGIGYPTDYFLNNDTSLPMLWFAGGGWSFGSYKCTFQLLGLYGKIQTRENLYENTGGLTLASNIKLFSDLALSLDVGYWISDSSDIQAVFSFSAGLCYRFRF